MAVAVTHRQGADDGLPALDALRELVGQLTVAVGDQQGRRRPVEYVLRPESEQILGGERPFDDAAGAGHRDERLSRLGQLTVKNIDS
jgi:hypothetical protein